MRRTALDIILLTSDDDMVNRAKKNADSRSLPMGQTAANLVRGALAPHAATHVVNEIRVFTVCRGAPRVTSLRVRELDAQQNERLTY